MSRVRSVYEVRDSDGKIVSRGNAQKLADDYYFTVSAIYGAAKEGHKLDRQYSVVRVGSEEVPNEINNKIIEYRESGMSGREIAAKLRMPKENVYTRITRMKRKGVIT